MKNILLIILCLASLGTNAQEINEDLSTEIYMRVYNPYDQDLHLIVSSRDKTREFEPSRFQLLKAKDTTQLYFPFYLEVDQTPSNKFRFTLHEDPNYYSMNDHYYWRCDRIKGEVYKCTHTLQGYFKHRDSTILDTAKYLFEEEQKLPIYETHQLDSNPDYEAGILSLMKEAREVINLPSDEYSVYVQFVVKRDGSLTDIQVLKSSIPEVDQKLIEFFEKKRFIPGYKYGRKVKSKFTLPITQKQ